jgi:hypothetical protein
MSGPGNDHRDTDTAFVQIPFISAINTVAVEEIGIGAPFHMRAVIARKDDDGVII